MVVVYVACETHSVLYEDHEKEGSETAMPVTNKNIVYLRHHIILLKFSLP